MWLFQERCTLRLSHSGTIVVLLYEMRLLWMFIKGPKNASTPISLNYIYRKMSGLSKEVLQVNFGQGVSKLRSHKVCGQKKFKTFWVRGYVLCSGARENTRENPKVQNWQTSWAYNFDIPWPKLTYDTSFESPDIFLYRILKILPWKHIQAPLWTPKVTSFHIIKWRSFRNDWALL